jgi:hypothetical protein
LLAQLVAVAHAPLVVQVCWALRPEHWVWPDVQTPWHAPPTHVWPTHAVALCQVPAELQVCGWVLDAHCVCPWPHWPPQAPLTQVWLLAQLVAVAHAPLAVQVCCALRPEHCVAPGLHATQAPARHAGVAPEHAAPAFCQAVPDALQTCG